jgi:hypothetical protein
MRKPLFPFASLGCVFPRMPLPRLALTAAPLALLAFLGALAFTGCAISTIPAARYRTSDSADVWVNGSRVHRQSARTLEFASTFEGISLDLLDGYPRHRSLNFLIAAANRSPAAGPAGPARLLDPMDFRLRIPGTDSALLPVDPELQLDKARADKAAEKGRYINEQGAEAMLTLPLLVLGVASLFADRTPEERRQDQEAEALRQNREAQSQERHERKMMEASDKERHWSGNTLRKTTLQPGAELQGRVLFAVDGFMATPDTLILQYREADAYTDLGVFVQPHDSLAEQKPAVTAPTPSTYPFRP